MPESLISRPLQYCDLPELSHFTAEFKYNFFTTNERTDESGHQYVDGNLDQTIAKVGQKNITTRVPRFVKLSYNVVDTQNGGFFNNKSSNFAEDKGELLTALENDLIFSETKMAGKDFDVYSRGLRNIEEECASLLQSFAYYFGQATTTSQLAFLNTLSQVSSVDPNLLESLCASSYKNFGFSSDEPNTGFFDEIADIHLIGQLNESYKQYALYEALRNGGGQNWSELIMQYVDYLNNATQDFSTVVSGLEYLLDIRFSNIELIESAVGSEVLPSARILGFIFDKTRIYEGVRYPMSPVVCVGENNRVAYDSKVAYGQQYEYIGRTIAKFQMPITDYGTGDVYLGTFYLASRPTAALTTSCTENRAPEPPVDINMIFDHQEHALNLLWSLPVNPQRDIKYVQVYRRRSTREGFQLLHHFDFDDSITVSEKYENVDSGAITYHDRPVVQYTDHEFTKDSSFIYALCTLDARNISSGYSAQFAVRFDRTTNRLVKDYISQSGAPKQYPNWYLRPNMQGTSPVFSETIQDSMHKNVHIYFNPEAYILTHQNGEETIPFVTKQSDPLASYVLQFINIDRQADLKITMTIDDQQTAWAGNNEENNFLTDVNA